MEGTVKRPLKYTLTIIAAIAAISIAATLLIHFIDLDPFRERIAGMASKVVGRQIQIEGHMDVNLFPHPEVILNNVSLANADWGTEPVMARIGHIDAAVNFFSLFSDTLIIRRVRLNDAAVLLEVKDDHSGNWVMDATAVPKSRGKEIGPGSPEDQHLPLFVESAEFNNVSLTVRSPGRTDQNCRIASFTLHSQPSGDLILESSGEALGRPMAFHCTITYNKSILGFRAVNADLKASLLDAQLTGRVSTDNLEDLTDLHGALRIDIENIRKILHMAQIEAPLDGPFMADTTFNKNGPVLKTSVTAKVNGVTAAFEGSYEDRQLDLDLTLTPLKRAGELYNIQGLKAEALDLKARVTQSATGGYDIDQLEVNAGETRLSAQGHIHADGNAQSELSLESPDPSALLSTWPAIPIQTKASVQYAAERIAVSDLTVTLDKNELKGELILDRSDKNHITANLRSETLDFRSFDRPDKPVASEKDTKPKNPYVFQETPLPMSLLESMELDLNLSANRVYYGKIALKDAIVDAKMHEGHMETKLKFDSLVSGHAAAKIELQTNDRQAVVDTLVSLSDFRAGLTSGKEFGPDEVPPVSMTLALNTTGASPRQMASTANGRILLTSGAGKTSDTAIKMFSNDIVNQLLTALNPFAKTDNFSNWDCTAVSADIVDGSAEIKTLVIQGEKVMIVGSGDIDLKTEKLNIEFQTKPRSGVGISAGMFVTPFIKAKGTLAQPSIGLNKKGTLLTGGAAVATGGLSFLIKGLFDRVTVEGDHCEKIMQSVGEHTPYTF
jgi:uncharacterized protein involved in outer membrane biogenesis